MEPFTSPLLLDLNKPRGRHLIVWSWRDTPVLESQNLADALEYVQDSVRKMITTDWSGAGFVAGVEYWIVTDAQEVRRFESSYADVLGLTGGKKRARADRGRMFLSESGVSRLLQRCSRPGVDAVRLALAKVFPSFRAPDVEVFDPGVAAGGATTDQTDPGADSRSGEMPKIEPCWTAEERRFRYNVLQTLLQQLGSLKEPALLQLALMAAETALDRSLPDIRRYLGLAHGQLPEPSIVPEEPPKGLTMDKILAGLPPVIVAPEGPHFSGEGFWSFTQIGDLAGGYSARVAGQAADVVAKRRMYTGAQIRRHQQSFNRFEPVRDSTSGKIRQVAHYNTEFSNEVVDELRSNPAFRPQEVDTSPLSFGVGQFPKLTAPVLEDDASA